ncbi:MAG: serine/threonine protein kinase [Archangiaceae bacterium]|nr:serine/threonine protein kinase [Archangiaceae bacterium]
MKCARCGAAFPDGAAACPSCLLSGEGAEVFAGLELHDELGRGGMGSVFKARHVKLGREVAVKFLAPEVAADAGMRARFEREAKAMGLLSHPHIVQVFDFGTEDGEAYLVMELAEGGPVSKKLPLPPKDAVRVTRQVCEALAYAHGRGVVHRDLKPENVLLDAEGRVKVSDFGIARILTDTGGAAVTRTGVAVGSAGYMAPEVLRGAAPAPAMDVFSVGALLRELVTGQPPVGELGALPMGLDTVVKKAMAAEPSERFSSMQAFADALERWLAPASMVELPTDERLWMRAVALVQTVSVAGMLWAGLLSVTPRVSAADDVPPLVSLGTRQLADGRVFTLARFETVPILISLAVFGVALGITALLRRHWRHEGLDLARPDVPLTQSRWVLVGGVSALGIYLLRHTVMAWAHAPPVRISYVPVVGGLWLLAVWYFAAYALLEAQRVGRPFSREPKVWAGLAFAAVPPLVDGLRQISERIGSSP